MMPAEFVVEERHDATGIDKDLKSVRFAPLPLLGFPNTDRIERRWITMSGKHPRNRDRPSISLKVIQARLDRREGDGGVANVNSRSILAEYASPPPPVIDV